VAKQYRRRSGVIQRSGILGGRPGNALTRSPNVIDGGSDARLSNRSRTIYLAAIALIVVVGASLIAFSR